MRGQLPLRPASILLRGSARTFHPKCHERSPSPFYIVFIVRSRELSRLSLNQSQLGREPHIGVLGSYFPQPGLAENKPSTKAPTDDLQAAAKESMLKTRDFRLISDRGRAAASTDQGADPKHRPRLTAIRACAICVVIDRQ